MEMERPGSLSDSYLVGNVWLTEQPDSGLRLRAVYASYAAGLNAMMKMLRILRMDTALLLEVDISITRRLKEREELCWMRHPQQWADLFNWNERLRYPLRSMDKGRGYGYALD